MSESHKLIDAALTSLREVYQEDTDTTVKRLDSLRQANTTATLRYIKKEEELKKLVRKSDTVKANSELFFRPHSTPGAIPIPTPQIMSLSS